MAHTEPGRQVLRQHLYEAHQELLRAHCEDENWPPGPALKPWVEQQILAHPELKEMMIDTPPGTGFRRPVQNAPIAAAMVSAYGLTPPARVVVFEIASLRTFDKRWFDEAYRLALTLMLGLLGGLGNDRT